MRRYSATPEPVPLVEEVGDDPASAVDSAPAGDTPADLPMPPDLDGVPDLKPLPGHEGVRLKKLAWGKQSAQNMVSPIRLASSRRSSRSAPVAAPWVCSSRYAMLCHPYVISHTSYRIGGPSRTH